MSINWPEMIVGIIVSILITDFMKLLPKASEKIVVFSSKRLKDEKNAEIRRIEWLGDLDEQSSDIMKFTKACECLIGSYRMDFDYSYVISRLGSLFVLWGMAVWFIYVTYHSTPIYADIKSLPQWGASLGFAYSSSLYFFHNNGKDFPD